MYEYLNNDQLAKLAQIKRNRDFQDQLTANIMQPSQGPGGGISKLITSLAAGLIMRNKNKQYAEQEKTLSDYAQANRQADLDIIQNAQGDDLSRALIGSPNPVYQKIGAALMTQQKKPVDRYSDPYEIALPDGKKILVKKNLATNEVRPVSSGGVNIDLGSKLNEKVMEAEVKSVMVPALEASKASGKIIRTYDTLEKTINKFKEGGSTWFTEPGMFPDFRLALGKALKPLEIDAGNVTSAEEIKRQTNEMTLSQVGNLKGAASDRDMAVVENAVINTSQTLDGMEYGLKVGRAAAKWEQEYNSRIAQWVRSGNPSHEFDNYIESIKDSDPKLSQLRVELDQAIDSLLVYDEQVTSKKDSQQIPSNMGGQVVRTQPVTVESTGQIQTLDEIPPVEGAKRGNDGNWYIDVMGRRFKVN